MYRKPKETERQKQDEKYQGQQKLGRNAGIKSKVENNQKHKGETLSSDSRKMNDISSLKDNGSKGASPPAVNSNENSRYLGTQCTYGDVWDEITDDTAACGQSSGVFASDIWDDDSNAFFDNGCTSTKGNESSNNTSKKGNDPENYYCRPPSTYSNQGCRPKYGQKYQGRSKSWEHQPKSQNYARSRTFRPARQQKSNSESWDAEQRGMNQKYMNKELVDAPQPGVNIWEQRKARMEFIETIQPHSEKEEEAMLRQAMELSRRQVVEDEKYRQVCRDYDISGCNDSSGDSMASRDDISDCNDAPQNDSLGNPSCRGRRNSNSQSSAIKNDTLSDCGENEICNPVCRGTEAAQESEISSQPRYSAGYDDTWGDVGQAEEQGTDVSSNDRKLYQVSGQDESGSDENSESQDEESSKPASAMNDKNNDEYVTSRAIKGSDGVECGLNDDGMKAGIRDKPENTQERNGGVFHGRFDSQNNSPKTSMTEKDVSTLPHATDSMTNVNDWLASSNQQVEHWQEHNLPESLTEPRSHQFASQEDAKVDMSSVPGDSMHKGELPAPNNSVPFSYSQSFSKEAQNVHVDNRNANCVINSGHLSDASSYMISQPYGYPVQPVYPSQLPVNPLAMQQMLFYSHPFFMQQLSMLNAHYASIGLAMPPQSGFPGMMPVNPQVQGQQYNVMQTPYSYANGIQSVSPSNGMTNALEIPPPIPPPVPLAPVANEIGSQVLAGSSNYSSRPPGFNDSFVNNFRDYRSESQHNMNDPVSEGFIIPPPVPCVTKKAYSSANKNDSIRKPKHKSTNFYAAKRS